MITTREHDCTNLEPIGNRGNDIRPPEIALDG